MKILGFLLVLAMVAVALTSKQVQELGVKTYDISQEVSCSEADFEVVMAIW